jgi:hypothetical protein
MFSFAYNKQTKFILYWRYDDVVNVEKLTAQQHLSVYCNNNNLDANNYTAIELPWNPKAQYVIGRDKFDESENRIYADTDWVAPVEALLPTPTE